MSLRFTRLCSFALVFILLGAGCTKGPSAETLKAAQLATINVWAVIENEEVYNQVLETYRKEHPNLQINFRRFRLEEYEQALLEGFAEDRGPDVFLIHNDWTGKYLSKITPMPASTKSAYKIVTGKLKKEEHWETRQEPTVSMRELKDQFVDVVAKDVVRMVNATINSEKSDIKERIIGLPVNIDTLALYYNKDLLNAAGIITPPETWGEFQSQVESLVKRDVQGTISQAGAGLGTAYNVERATDLLSVLMMQSGAVMANMDGIPTFHQMPKEMFDREQPPGHEALRFYTDFANPGKANYSWNASLPNSLEMFIQGRSAFFFGYSYHLDQIRSRSPRMNISIAKLPQIGGSNPARNFANYWYWVVAKKSKKQDVAWNLVNYFAKPEISKKILSMTKRPAARKSLLKDQMEDENIGVFVSQALTAWSWYRGSDPRAMEQAFLAMIDDVVNGVEEISVAERRAADKISQTIRF